MSLTPHDIQAFKQALQPEFDRIDKRFDRVDNRFDELRAYVDKKFDEIDKKFVMIDLRFDEIDKKFDTQYEQMMSGFREIMGDVFPEFDKQDIKLNNHEERICTLESTYQHQTQ